MTARVMKVDKKQNSKHGGFFFYVFFKDVESGNSYRSCLYPAMGNYRHWDGLLVEGNILTNLRIINRQGKETRIIDADSRPEFLRKEAA